MADRVSNCLGDSSIKNRAKTSQAPVGHDGGGEKSVKQGFPGARRNNAAASRGGVRRVAV